MYVYNVYQGISFLPQFPDACRSSLASSRWLLASLMQVVINISEVVVIMGVGHHPLETWWLSIVVVVVGQC